MKYLILIKQAFLAISLIALVSCNNSATIDEELGSRAPFLDASSLSLTFSTNAVGLVNQQNISISNIGPSSSTSCSDVTIEGDHAAQFTLSNDTCGQRALLRGENCNLNIEYNPITSGPHTAFLSYTCSNSNGSRNLKVLLSGTVNGSDLTPDISQSSISILTNSSPADGSSTNIVKVTLKNSAGVALNGITPTLSAIATVIPSITCETTNVSGEANCAITSTKAENIVLNLSSPNLGLSTTISFIPGAASATHSSIQSSGPHIADNLEFATITVTLKDTNNNPLNSVIPTIHVSGSGNNLSSCSTTDMNGLSTCTLSTTKAEVKTISLLGPALGITSSVTFIPGAPSAVTSSISSNGPYVANNLDLAEVSIQLKDVYSNPISAITPIITSSGSGNEILGCSISDVAGISTCTLKSTKAEIKTITLSSPNLGLTTTATFEAGAAHASTSTIAGTSSTATAKLFANETDLIPVTITLRDINSNPVIGTTPTFKVYFGAGNTSAINCNATNSSGVANCSFKTFKPGLKRLKLLTPIVKDSSDFIVECMPAATNQFITGSGTLADPFLISNYKGLEQMRCYNTGTVNVSNFKLLYDIDLNGIEWEPLLFFNLNTTNYSFIQREYMASLDGDNKKISNMTIDTREAYLTTDNTFSKSSTGFIGITRNSAHEIGIVRNLTFENPTVVSNNSRVGVIAGTYQNIISNVTVVGASVTGRGETGGLVGNLVNNGTAGTSNQGKIISSSFSGTIQISSASGENGAFGGLVGVNSGGSSYITIESSKFNGTITCATNDTKCNQVGGIIGQTNIINSRLDKVIAQGNISGNQNVGGIGGIMVTTNISESASFVNVVGTSNVGGFVGRLNTGNSLISDSLHQGSITGTGAVGGIIGSGAVTSGNNSHQLSKNFTIFTFPTLPTGFSGGLVGELGGTLASPAVNVQDNNFWDKTISNISVYSSQAAVRDPNKDNLGKTTTEMQTPSTFTAAFWNTSIWTINSGFYPVLKNLNY